MKEHISEKLKTVPSSPGVYIHRDELGQIIYVGKAISLRNRLRQYFQSKKNMDLKVRSMVDHIADFEYIVCENEMEAFILENNLIKKNKPKYNILLKDDKTYPYIKLTLDEKWPRILKTRIVEKDGSRYFGPYTDVTSMNVMVDLLNDVFRLKHCNAKRFRKDARPCLNYHIGRCDGICIGAADREEYLGRVSAAEAFLSGKDKSLIQHLKKKMQEASSRLDFEKAAKYRDYMRSAQSLMEKQRVDFKKDIDIDAVLTVGEKHVALFPVRDGKLAGREMFELSSGEADTDESRIGEFIKQYYSEIPKGPSEILVSDVPSDSEMIEEFLAGLWDRKVSIHKPKKGEKRALLKLAESNRNEMLKNIEGRQERIEKKNEEISNEIAQVIGLITGDEPSGENSCGTLHAVSPGLFRIEAYDVSNTNGVDTVAAMVVFKGIRPDKKSYRRFKIRTNMPGDDYASMQEALYRRFKRALDGDRSFADMPDLVVIDGGKGHLAAALQIEKALGIFVPTVGAVKDDSHRTRGLVYIPHGESAPCEIKLEERPKLFSYIGNIQEEVHRFAIEYHRKLRDKGSLVSVLDEIEGIGRVKRNALLQQFGSIKNIRKATKEQLMQTRGITKKNAENIIAFFAKDKDESGLV